MTSFDPAAVAAWVRATTAAQGLPEKVTDTTVLADVAVMLATGTGRSGCMARQRHARPGPRPAASSTPVRHQPARIELAPTSLGSRQHPRAGEHCPDHSDLPR